MRHFLIAAAFVLTFATAGKAQIAGRHDYGRVGAGDPFIGDSSFGFPGAAREARDIRGRIKEGVRSGQISRGEARQLRRETRRFGRTARLYRRDGITAPEVRMLTAWARALRGLVGPARLRTTPAPWRGRRG